MERPVKERLIGAAVLVAAAIILIPEMLSGPADRAGREQATAATEVRSQGGIKTYTIDLNQPPGSAVTRVDAPPAETAAQAPVVPPAPMPQPAPEVTQPAPEPPPAQTAPPRERVLAPAPRPAPAAAPPARPAAAAPAPAPARPAPQPAPRAQPAPAPAPAPAASSASGWAVQLGSFSRQATADTLVREWRGRGQQAFVMPVRSGSTTLYRVRIGPMQNREAAEAVLQRVRATVPNAAVVAHP